MHAKKISIPIVACLFILCGVWSAGVFAQETSSDYNNKKAIQDGATSKAKSNEQEQKSGDSDDASAEDSGQKSRQSAADETLDTIADQRQEDRPIGLVRRTPRNTNKRYRFEFGVLPRYNSNLFESEDEAPKQGAFIISPEGSFEYDLVRREGSTLRAGLRLRRNIFTNLDGADSTDIDLALGYEFGRNRLAVAYLGTPRRLAFIDSSNQNVYNSINAVRFDYALRMTRRLRVRTSYEFGREEYTEFKERDSSRHDVRGSIRYRLRNYFAPGIGFEYQRINGRSDTYTREGLALVLLLESTIRDVANMSFRYRYWDRDYLTLDPSSSNFGRQDRRHDITLYSNVKLGKGFWLFGLFSYNDNNSSRLTRTFTGYESGVGLFYRFP